MHAKLAPSSAARRMACPGSRALEAQYPETVESVFSREGTAAHWVAQQYLLGNFNLPIYAPNGELITKEMLQGADIYEHEIKWISRENTLHIEEWTDISNIHPDCWGTPDCWFLVDDHLYIFDYKFGHGYVEVYENWQLLEYASGISQKVSFSKVSLIIIQPRNFMTPNPMRSWTLTVQDLYNYMVRLRKSEAESLQPDALLKPSNECTHCLGRHACNVLQATVGRILDITSSTISFELTPIQTGIELKHLRQAAQLLEARMTGLEEQAKSMIMRGEFLPGFKLEAGQGREHWTKDTAEVITLGEVMGLNLCKPQETITPAQARKIGIHEDVLQAYSQRIPGKLKLVENTNEASKVFKK